jgi:putative heme transporter
MRSTPSRSRWVATLAVKASLVLGVAFGGLWIATHGVAGVMWSDVLAVVDQVSPWRFGLLAAVWLGGLGIYSLVLSAALPGLGVRRALLLNLTGSAVANAVPLGGAVATGLNWRMTRLWGHSDEAFVTYCVLTNALDVATKLFLPLVAVAVLVAVSAPIPASVWFVAGACVVALLLMAGIQRASSRAPHRSAARLRPRDAVLHRLRESTRRVSSLLADRWPRLVPASAGYIAAQVLLLVLSLHAVGLDAAFSTVLMAAAIERLGTLIPLTPGGAGVAELGTVAWLIAMGLDPAGSVAGVLLYRVFLVLMEIPVGGALLGAWAWACRTGSTRGAAAAA